MASDNTAEAPVCSLPLPELNPLRVTDGLEDGLPYVLRQGLEPSRTTVHGHHLAHSPAATCPLVPVIP